MWNRLERAPGRCEWRGVFRRHLAGMFLIRILGLASFIAALSLQSAPLTFYVATNGNDRWSGTLASPNGRWAKENSPQMV